MSRPIARVVLVTLIGAILIAATYMTVQNAFAKADAQTAGAQAPVVSGLQTNFKHDRSTVTELESPQLQNDASSQPGVGRRGGGGSCESEMQTSPLE
jgi:hypothetical protein